VKFYTSVIMNKGKILLRGYEHGRKFSRKVPYKPYLFINSKSPSDTKYKTVDGKPVGRVDFENVWEAREFLNQYKDVESMPVYGMTNFEYPFIRDEYAGEIQYDPALVSIASLDIEVSILDGLGFPDIIEANNPVTLITISKNGKKAVFGCRDYEVHQPNIQYYKCTDERALLRSFLAVWAEYDPDIVTGWNIEGFDMPYLINRMMKVLGDEKTRKLSPWGYFKTGSMMNKGVVVDTPVPAGIAILDYMQLYKKFAFTQQESFSLNHVAFEELGEKKVDYGEYGSLAGLERGNFQLYTEYNIRDVELVDLLDEKLKLIELVLAMAYNAKVNFEDTFTTVRMWDVLIHNYLLDRNRVIHQFKKSGDMRGIVGGYVKAPQVGMHKWVVSMDLNSLYPHIIMQYNISPEMYRGRFGMGVFDIPALLNGYMAQHKDYLTESNFSVTANMCVFDRAKQGFLPAIMAAIYDDRVKYKKDLKVAKQKFEKIKDKASEAALLLEKDIARLDNLQMAKKIQLNGGYGALANQWNRWYETDFAEAITMCGQLTTMFIEGKINEYLNKLFKTTGVDYVIACDTDSVYFKLDTLVDTVYGKDQSDRIAITKFIDKVCVEKIEPYVAGQFEVLAGYMNARENKMKMGRECIADRAIWTAKKRYILNVYNLEGVAYETPKLKMMGIEAIRTSTPAVCRTAIKETLQVIMRDNELELQEYVKDFRDRFTRMGFDEVAFPRGANDLEKWSDAATVWKKATPIAVRGALVYNHQLKKKGLTKELELIPNGSKIKYCYMAMPNPIQSSVLSCPNGLPAELKMEKFIDYDQQFFKAYLKPITTITEAIGWEAEKRATLDAFFA
jgi:DNA polymerase elongation subunit (family B)